MQRMKLTSFDQMNCSLAQTLSVIGEHWTLLIIRDAFAGRRRFDQFHKNLGISRNMLSNRLKKLVTAQILEKRVGDGHPSYHLTDKGLALQPVLISMTHWGDNYMPNKNGWRLSFVDRRDGKPIKAMAVYASDGRKLTPKEVKAVPGPGLQHDTAIPRSTHVSVV